MFSRQYGPWEVLETTAPLDEDSMRRIVPTTDPVWVLKIATTKSPDFGNELANLLLFVDRPPRHMIDVPPDPCALFGCRHDLGERWFAMRRYDGHLAVDDWARRNWKRIALAGLEFLEDVHRRQRHVYMDFKPQNVLVDRTACRVVFADYEMCDNISAAALESYGEDLTWYFLARGAEPGKALYSWRMDLTGLAYLMAEVLWPTDYLKPTFTNVCNRALLEKKVDMTVEELVALRVAEMERCAHPVVRRLLERIAEIPWDSLTPPSRAFYAQLRALVQGGDVM